MTGYERLKCCMAFSTREAGSFLDFSWLARPGFPQGLYRPVLFPFWRGRYFRMGRKSARFHSLKSCPGVKRPYLIGYSGLETGVIVNLHIHSIDQTEAIRQSAENQTLTK